MNNDERIKQEARNIATLTEIAGGETAKQILKNIELAHQQCERMKKDFDNNIPFETMIIKIEREYGQAIVMSAAMEWLHWFIIERIPLATENGP